MVILWVVISERKNNIFDTLSKHASGNMSCHKNLPITFSQEHCEVSKYKDVNFFGLKTWKLYSTKYRGTWPNYYHGGKSMQELVEYSFQQCARAYFCGDHKSFLHNNFDSHIVTYMLGMKTILETHKRESVAII